MMVIEIIKKMPTFLRVFESSALMFLGNFTPDFNNSPISWTNCKVAVSCLSLSLFFHWCSRSAAHTVLMLAFFCFCRFVAAIGSTSSSPLPPEWSFRNLRFLRIYHWLKFWSVRIFALAIGQLHKIWHALIQSFWGIFSLAKYAHAFEFLFLDWCPTLPRPQALVLFTWFAFCVCIVVRLAGCIVARWIYCVVCVLSLSFAIWPSRVKRKLSLQLAFHPTGYKLQKTDRNATPSRV